MRVVEYGQIGNETVSTRTVLERRTHEGREYRLEHDSIGWEPAGSMARLREHEIWSVRFYLGGAVHGRQFRTECEARSLFDEWTKKEDTLSLHAPRSMWFEEE